jgi:hypothetical protein
VVTNGGIVAAVVMNNIRHFIPGIGFAEPITPETFPSEIHSTYIPPGHQLEKTKKKTDHGPDSEGHKCSGRCAPGVKCDKGQCLDATCGKLIHCKDKKTRDENKEKPIKSITIPPNCPGSVTMTPGEEPYPESSGYIGNIMKVFSINLLYDSFVDSLFYILIHYTRNFLLNL